MLIFTLLGYCLVFAEGEAATDSFVGDNCDQNSDGQFTNKDLVLFWKKCKGSSEPDCDLNGDGKFDHKDVKLLKEECQGQSSGKIPDTGQTQSYTDVFGEDSDYLINPPSYTDNHDGTVTDNVTGLMWQQTDDDYFLNWYVAVSYCQYLTLAGYRDWRLPSKKELVSIVNYSLYYPAIDETYFPETNTSIYWTSTTFAHYAGSAWYVFFGDGSVNTVEKSYNTLTRCVRGGQ